MFLRRRNLWKSRTAIAFSIALVGLLAFTQPLAAADSPIEVTARYEQSLRGTLHGYPVLVLRGNHYERGKAHGVLVGKDIVRVFNGTILPLLALQDRRMWDEKFVARSRQFAFPERYERELTGMLAGIEEVLPNREDRMLPALGRILDLDDLKAINCLSDLLRMGCSSFAAWGERTKSGEILVARNLDYMALPLSQSMMLLAVDPEEEGLKSTIDVSAFGAVGATTIVNEEGVFAAIHDARGQSPTARSGWIPRTLAIRSAVEIAGDAQPAVDVARALQNVPVSVGTNLHVVGPRTDTPQALPGVVEWDSAELGSGLTLRRPHNADADEMLCTNHYLARPGGTNFGSSSWRLRTLDGDLARHAESGKPIDATAAKKMLDDVARNGAVVTHLSVIAWPQTRKMLVARSPVFTVSATRGGWVEVDWPALFDLKPEDFADTKSAPAAATP